MPPKPNPIAAVLFDLDHTLTDRPASITAMSHKWLTNFGSVLDFKCTADQIASHITAADGNGYRTRDETLERLLVSLPWTTKPSKQTLLDFWLKEFPACAVGRPKMMEVLQHAQSRGHKLGIITNGSAASQNGKIDALKIRHLMSTVVVSKAVGYSKPDPRIFQLALTNLNIPASAALFIGDHPQNDILGSRNAGLTPIWLTGVFDWPSTHPFPPHRISTLEELIPHL